MITEKRYARLYDKMLRFFKRVFDKLTCLVVPNLSYRQRLWFAKDRRTAKEKTAFFIEYCKAYMTKLNDISSDHEPDEIEESMRYYERQLMLFAQVSRFQHPFDNTRNGDFRELKIDNLPNAEIERRFFECIDFADTHNRVYINTVEKHQAVENYIKAFGLPSDIKALILKAEILCDDKLVKMLRSYSGEF